MHTFHIIGSRKVCLLGGLVVAALRLSVLVVTAQGPKPGQALQVTSVAGTGFTYQGQLRRGGAPVNGICAFRFALYDAPSLGTRAGVTQTLATVPISGGLFTVNVEFGTGAFTGDARWLDIQAACPSGGVYTALTRAFGFDTIRAWLDEIRSFNIFLKEET